MLFRSQVNKVKKAINTYLSIITLNVNGLNAQIKDTERQILYNFTHMWNLKQTNKTNKKLIDTEDRSVVIRGEGS